MTSGVLPLPPAVRLPTTITGTGNRSTRRIPRRYSARRNAAAAANSADSGVNNSVSGVSRLAYQSRTRMFMEPARLSRPALLRRRLRGERDVDEARDACGFHHVYHRLMCRIGVGVDDDHRLLVVAGRAFERIRER